MDRSVGIYMPLISNTTWKLLRLQVPQYSGYIYSILLVLINTYTAKWTVLILNDMQQGYSKLNFDVMGIELFGRVTWGFLRLNMDIMPPLTPNFRPTPTPIYPVRSGIGFSILVVLHIFGAISSKKVLRKTITLGVGA